MYCLFFVMVLCTQQNQPKKRLIWTQFWEKLRIFFSIFMPYLMIIWSSNFKFWVPRSITTYFYLIIHCSWFSSSSSRFGMRSDHGLSFDPWMKGWNPFKNPMSFFSLAIFSSSTCTLLWGFSTSFCPFLYNLSFWNFEEGKNNKEWK